MSDARPTSPRPARSPAWPGGVLWMLFPAAVAALAGALWLARVPVPGGAVGGPPVADPDGIVPALGGRLEGRDGTALVARLAPMHADPARQAFEAGALRGRLGLEPGAPYRLSIWWERGGLEDAGAVLHLGSVSVVDGEGTALRPISGGDGDPRAGEAAGGDPVRALFRAPRGTLGPGEAVDWILWGREPRSDDPEAPARLVGLLPAGDQSEELEARAGLAGTVPLAPLAVRRSELVLPVARLDRGDGKTSADASSGEPGGALATGH